MKKRISGVVVSCLMSVLASSPGVQAAPGNGACIDDWSVAAEIVVQERLTTVEELASAARRTFGGAIVRTALCREDGRYVYRLVIRKKGGEISQRRVDARNPF